MMSSADSPSTAVRASRNCWLIAPALDNDQSSQVDRPVDADRYVEDGLERFKYVDRAESERPEQILENLLRRQAG
jgi:hypothetical protein